MNPERFDSGPAEFYLKLRRGFVAVDRTGDAVYAADEAFTGDAVEKREAEFFELGGAHFHSGDKTARG